MPDFATVLLTAELVKQIPDTAAQRAEAAQAAAEAAADTVTTATVAETKEYLGIS